MLQAACNPLNIISQFLFPTKNQMLPLLCPFAASWPSRLQQRTASEAVRRWSVMSSTYCHSHRQSWVSQKAQFEHRLLHRSSIESVRSRIRNSEPNFQLSPLLSAVSPNRGLAAVKRKTFSRGCSVHVTFKPSSVHPKQLHTGSKRGCSCDCRTIPLCCSFQLLHRRRQHCYAQKLLTIKAAASVSQERLGGTKTSYIRCQRTSRQQEGEFSAFPELFPLSCLPPSVQGTESLSQAGLTTCSFFPASLS